MRRLHRLKRYASRNLVWLATALVLAIPVAVTGCYIVVAFNPSVKELPSVGAAVVMDSLESADDADYFKFTLGAEHGAVTVVTAGDTDTAGQVEATNGTPITEPCDRDSPRAPCVFSYHEDTAASAPNFGWIGRLAAGTYYVRVTSQRQATGSYEFRFATWDSGPEPPFTTEPTRLVISKDAATGPDYAAEGSIDEPGQIDYYALVLKRNFNTVTIMTSGATDTAGQVEVELRVPITKRCVGIRPEATPPCVWGSDEDIVTPNPERSTKFNSMAPSQNFIWEGKLATGTHYIRVTGPGGATGRYTLTVETADINCPVTADNPMGYYCDD